MPRKTLEGVDPRPMLLLLGMVALITVVVLGIAASGAAAQTQPTNNTTTTTTVVENQTGPTYVASVDDRGLLKIVSYSYDGGTFRVVLEAERPTLVAVSDMGGAVAPGGGARRITQERKSVPKGRSVLQIEAGTYRGVATVSVASPDGAVALTSKHSEPLIGGNYTADDARLVGATTLATAFLLVVVVFARRRASEGGRAQRFL